MRSGMGPILTTGVALAVAAVVVANPIVAPRPDIQIPAVNLSATGDALDMLNKDFIDAIAPTERDSATDPLAVLKDLISSLAADASYLGRNAIVAAFFAGATAVTQPELTAMSSPYFPEAASPSVPWTKSSTDVPAEGAAYVPGTTPSPVEQILAASTVPAELEPFVADIVTSVVQGVSDGDAGQLIDAAFTVGAMLAVGGREVISSVIDLVSYEVQAVLRIAGALATVGSDPRQAISEVIDVVNGQIRLITGQRQSASTSASEPTSQPVVAPVVAEPESQGAEAVSSVPASPEAPAPGSGVPGDSPATATVVDRGATSRQRDQRVTSGDEDTVVLPAAEPTSSQPETELPAPEPAADIDPVTPEPEPVPDASTDAVDAVTSGPARPNGSLRGDSAHRGQDRGSKGSSDRS